MLALWKYLLICCSLFSNFSAWVVSAPTSTWILRTQILSACLYYSIQASNVTNINYKTVDITKEFHFHPCKFIHSIFKACCWQLGIVSNFSAGWCESWSTGFLCRHSASFCSSVFAVLCNYFMYQTLRHQKQGFLITAMKTEFGICQMCQHWKIWTQGNRGNVLMGCCQGY